MLAREKRVDAQPSFIGKLLETAALYFMRNEHSALIFRKILERGIQLFQQYAACVDRIRPGIGRREQIFEQKRVWLVFSLVCSQGHLAPRFRLPLAKTIDNAVS